MKHIFFILLFSITTGSLLAQKSTIDERLLVEYKTKELKTLQAENPEELQYLTHCIENSFSWGIVPQEKVALSPESFKKITLQNTSIDNFYELDIKILEHITQYFIVNESDQLLIVKSKEQLLQELKK